MVAHLRLRGLDPNIWRNNVELIAARRIGEETVTYVANIYRYYVAYRLAQMEEDARKQERERLRGGRVPATPRCRTRHSGQGGGHRAQ